MVHVIWEGFKLGRKTREGKVEKRRKKYMYFTVTLLINPIENEGIYEMDNLYISYYLSYLINCTFKNKEKKVDENAPISLKITKCKGKAPFQPHDAPCTLHPLI